MTYWTSGQVTLLHGDVMAVLRELPAESVHCVITSPPYWGLRSYLDNGHADKPLELGLEESPDAYVSRMVEVFREVRRVLRADGTCWLNLGDSYASSGQPGTQNLDKLGERLGTGGGHKHSSQAVGRAPTTDGLKPKDLIGIPWRVALALQADGWWLRSAVVWCKASPMPESCQDRPSSATEMLFLLTKSATYFYDIEATRVLAYSLNGSTALQEVGLKGGGAASGSFPSQGRDVSLNDECAPYLVLAALLGAKRVLVEEGDHALSQLFDLLKTPAGRRVGLPILADAWIGTAAEVLFHVLQHIDVVVSENDLDAQSKLWVRLSSRTDAVKDIEAAFSVEQAREVIAELIANAQVLRDAVAIDAIAEGSINIDVVCEAISLFEGSYPRSSLGGHGLVTQALTQQIRLALSNEGVSKSTSVVGQEGPLFAGDVTANYTTQPPAGRNLWNWWVINPEPTKEAHFATYPTALVKPCILAGTSERGCCAACGAPWERVVERERVEQRDGRERNRGGRTDGYTALAFAGGVKPDLLTTTGWRPTCACDAMRVPCVVLDPFVGSGTTCMVATQLGRHSIGIDLNAEYLELAVKRNQQMGLELPA